MKKFFQNCLRITLAISVLLLSGIALWIQCKGNDFDPAAELKKLVYENRTDEALETALFFEENGIGDKAATENFVAEHQYSLSEKSISFSYDGFIKGDVHDTWSGIGAVLADFCIVGDIRDIGIQSWKLILDKPDFDGICMALSATGIILSTTAFIDLSNAFAKNTLKYQKRIGNMSNKGVLKTYTSGTMSSSDCAATWNLLKTNGWSIPRTTTCLSRIAHPKNLPLVSKLIDTHKKAGFAFINLTGAKGFNLYASLPTKAGDFLITAFKRNPAAVTGLTRTHFIIHMLKALEKYRLPLAVTTLMGLILIPAELPSWILWLLLTASSAYLYLKIRRLLKRIKTKFKKKGNSPICCR